MVHILTFAPMRRPRTTVLTLTLACGCSPQANRMANALESVNLAGKYSSKDEEGDEKMRISQCSLMAAGKWVPPPIQFPPETRGPCLVKLNGRVITNLLGVKLRIDGGAPCQGQRKPMLSSDVELGIQEKDCANFCASL